MHRASVDDDDIVTLDNGCICCTINEDLVSQVKRVVALGTLEHIFIETSGLACPQPILDSLEVVEDLLDEDQTDLVDDEEQKGIVDLADEADVIDDAKMIEPTLEPDVLSAMAQEATTSGVMQAIPGTEQGATGWYVDANATVQHWTVGADGSWTKTQA